MPHGVRPDVRPPTGDAESNSASVGSLPALVMEVDGALC
jgi:hypothetical protein